MAEPTILCVHGYGVRGDSWRWLRSALEAHGADVDTPDLQMASVESITEDVRRRTAQLAENKGAPIGLVGHSLGAAVLAALTQEALPRAVRAVVLIAPPFGEQPEAPGKLMRLLLQKQLIPQFLIRPRFFSTKSPKERQKELFGNAVPESDALRDAIFARRWFHNELLRETSTVPALVVASDADRVVSSGQSNELAAQIGAKRWIAPRTERIGHDDYLAAPDVVDELANRIVRFIEDHA